jgi:hypothetical protein
MWSTDRKPLERTSLSRTPAMTLTNVKRGEEHPQAVLPAAWFDHVLPQLLLEFEEWCENGKLEEVTDGPGIPVVAGELPELVGHPLDP